MNDDIPHQKRAVLMAVPLPLLAFLALASTGCTDSNSLGCISCTAVGQPPTCVPVAARRHQLITRPGARPYAKQTHTPTTRALLYLNAGIFVLTAPAFSRIFPWRGLYSAMAKSDAMIQRGQIHRLATACCLHADVPHLIINSMSLNNLGPTVERWYGSRRFISAYVCAGVAGNCLSFAMRRSPVAVGASGAIFGLLGAHMAFLQINKNFFESAGIQVSRSLTSMLQVCALNAAFGLSPGSNIDNLGHLGGFLGGAAAGVIFGPRLRRLPYTGGLLLVDEPLVRLPWDDKGRRRRRALSGHQ